MKRALLALALCATGCSNRALPLPISIVGLNSIQRVGSVDGGLPVLFIASTDGQELRVLDLDPNAAPAGSGNPRDFIRAPDPIEPLSIPVLDRPIAVASDVTWFFGNSTAGPWVYARGAADSEISVVSADRTQLYEWCRLEVSGVVTALAARAPDAQGATSRLFYATTDGLQTSLYETDIPGPSSLLRTPSSDHFICVSGPSTGPGLTPPPLPSQLLLSLSGQTVASMIVLPFPSQGEAWPAQGLAVALHDTQGGGQTLLLDTQTLATRPLGFPGPIKALTTHDRASLNDGGVLIEGSLVFGVLDEAACGDFPSCNGVVAVDMNDGGALALDQSGQPMLNLGVNDTLITGLTVTPNGPVVFPNIDPTQPQAATLQLLGIMSCSNGGVYFFDGTTMEFVNSDPSPADISRDVNGNPSLTYYGPDGGVLDIVACTGPGLNGGSLCNDAGSPFGVGTGSVFAQVMTVYFSGMIPALENLPTSPSQWPAFTVPTSVLSEIQVGDIVQLSSPDGTCSAEFPITSAAQSPIVVDMADAGFFDGGCANANLFSVRAGAQTLPDGGAPQPFVVVGATEGFMGRVGQNQIFSSLQRAYYFHPVGFVPPGPPEITFQMQAADPTCLDANGNALLVEGGVEPVCQDAQYVFTLNSNFAPEFFTVDPRIGTGFQFPEALQYDGCVGGCGIGRLFVAYPAANAVMEVPTDGFAPNQLNYLNLQPYR